MKTYQAVFNELTTEGVFGISLVENPAMEGLFVALSEDEKLVKHDIKLTEIDKEQRILMGLVLEPNKPVYRNQDGEEFNIVFNEDTIKNLSYHFFKANNQKNSTIEHKDKIDGVTFVESWIVEDSKIDKSAIHGFSYPKGSWIATMKVDSEEVWNDYVKTGKVQGFSVDAMLELKEVNLKSEIDMSINEKILALLRKVDARVGGSTEIELAETEVESVEVKMGSVKTSDGAMTFEYEGEELVAGVAVWAMSEDGMKVPIPVGEYALEGDIVLVVEEEGIVSSVGAATVEEEVETPMSEGADNATPNPLADLADIKSIMIKYQEENAKAMVEMQETIKGIKSQVVTLSEQPADKPKKVIEQVALSSKGRILNKIRNK